MLALLGSGSLHAAAPTSAVNLGARLDSLGLEHSGALGWESVRLDFDEGALETASQMAVAGALDRRALEEAFVRGDGRVTNTLYPRPGPRGAAGDWAGSRSTEGPTSLQIAVPEGDDLLRLFQKAIQLQWRAAGIESELVTAEMRTFYGEWRADAPTEASLVRSLGRPGSVPPGEAAALADADPVPMFNVETMATWRSGVEGVAPNPTIEGPLWDMQEWARAKG
jgi:hypothetical protein